VTAPTGCGRPHPALANTYCVLDPGHDGAHHDGGMRSWTWTEGQGGGEGSTGKAKSSPSGERQDGI
jgi:hypothetical protein